VFFICTKQFASNILLACNYTFKFVLNYNKYIDIVLLDSSFTRCGTLSLAITGAPQFPIRGC